MFKVAQEFCFMWRKHYCIENIKAMVGSMTLGILGQWRCQWAIRMQRPSSWAKAPRPKKKKERQRKSALPEGKGKKEHDSCFLSNLKVLRKQSSFSSMRCGAYMGNGRKQAHYPSLPPSLSRSFSSPVGMHYTRDSGGSDFQALCSPPQGLAPAWGAHKVALTFS